MLAGFAAVMIVAGQAQAQTAGVVQFVAGEVKLGQAGGSERAARKGTLVSVGDTLRTAAGSLAQLKMGDGAIVVVQPESRVTVAEFHYAGREDGTEKVRYRLERGGFRAVTGAIGRTHKRNYLIETPVAHIGVRGTDHESYYFPAGGPSNGEAAKPGAYNKVNTGMTFIRTGAGEVEIRPNEVGYVASASQVPVILPAVPGFFNRSIAPLSGTRPAVDPAPAATPVARVDQEVMSAQGQSLVQPGGLPPPAGGGAVTLVGYSPGPGIPIRSGNGLAVEPNGATLANAGGEAAWGVNWGSWQGNLATVGGQATDAPTHFISSTAMTTAAQLAALPPGLVTANYSYAGGPAPTSNLGQAGSITSLRVGVNFSTQQINYALEAVAAGTWNATGGGSIAEFTGSSGIGLTGTCTGCTAGTPNARGTAHGAFVGTAAERMITTFGLRTAGDSISGAALLRR